MSFTQEQKELRRPDELQKLGQQALPWMEQHGRTVVAAVLGVGVLGLLVTVVQHLGERAELKAASQFGAALNVLDREVRSTGTAAEGEEPPFKTNAERDEALIAQLQAFRQANPGKKAAVAAALPLAQALLRQGKFAEAAPLVDAFLAGADANDPLRVLAYEARGYVFEAQQRYDEAAAAFDQMQRETKTDFMKGMGAYHRARMLELKGDLQGAANALRDVEASAANGAAARLAKERLALLAGKGVQPATLPPPSGFTTTDAGK